MSPRKITQETSENCSINSSKCCPCAKFLWLIIPVVIASITWWILKSTDSVFSSDPLSVWFSMVLSVFVGVWMSVGLKRITGKKNCSMNSK